VQAACALSSSRAVFTACHDSGFPRIADCGDKNNYTQFSGTHLWLNIIRTVAANSGNDWHYWLFDSGVSAGMHDRIFHEISSLVFLSWSWSTTITTTSPIILSLLKYHDCMDSWHGHPQC